MAEGTEPITGNEPAPAAPTVTDPPVANAPAKPDSAEQDWDKIAADQEYDPVVRAIARDLGTAKREIASLAEKNQALIKERADREQGKFESELDNFVTSLPAEWDAAYGIGPSLELKTRGQKEYLENRQSLFNLAVTLQQNYPDKSRRDVLAMAHRALQDDIKGKVHKGKTTPPWNRAAAPEQGKGQDGLGRGERRALGKVEEFLRRSG